MASTVESILEILEECHLGDDEFGVKELEKRDSVDKIKNEVEKLLRIAGCNLAAVEYANLNKMLALCYLKTGEEDSAVCHLIESHAVILRQQILHRYLKTEMRKEILNTPQTYGLNSSYVTFKPNDAKNISGLRRKLSELPEEWYMIQITAQHQILSSSNYTKATSSTMHSMHITVLPTGPEQAEPFCVTLPKPESHFSYDICTEIQKLLCSNRWELEATYANNELYWKMREKQNNTMKTAVHELEYAWLREWRILFMADPLDKEAVSDLLEVISKLVSDYKGQERISDRSRWFLRKIASSACFLTREEIARAVKHVLPDHEKLANNVILSLYGKLNAIQPLRSTIRKTLVLIVDEHMDYIPFESMEILKSQPVTRFPSLHVAYALFKEHEDTIVNGCKLINRRPDMGTCIVNPSGNLEKMEKRMRLFIEYWLPNWKSLYNVEPRGEMFEDALVNHDILMYNGHGSGIQYLPGEQIERLRVKSIVLLFGCCSVKLHSVGGRYPPYGVSNQYLIASSPSVLGMLWEVTDADIDKMTANFISSWIPSECERPWSEVDTNAWCCGTLKFLENSERRRPEAAQEPEMLRAVAKSKDACSQFMTAAAIVVRGLPIKLV